MFLPHRAKGQDKGKRKAGRHPTEHDPLLPSSSNAAGVARPPLQSSPSRLRHVIAIIVTVLFSLLLSAFLLLALLAYSFKPSESEIERLQKSAFAYSGPDNVQVIDISDNGIYINVTLHCGIDTDTALAISQRAQESDSEQDRGNGVFWWEELRKWVVNGVLDYLDAEYLTVETEDIVISPKEFDSPPLLSLSILDPLHIPLVRDVDRHKLWLRPLIFTALARPIASTGQLWDFVQHAWINREAKMVIGMNAVEGGLRGGWWSKYAHARKENVVLDLSLQGKLPADLISRVVPRPFLVI